jgi:S-(hydroxymethyl)glutathione dehydrogenase/alcohol dehydrogenase
VVTGVQSQKATITLPQTEVSIRGRALISCQNGRVQMRRDVPRYVALLEDGAVDAAPIITGRYALDEINDALEASAARRDLTGVITP